MLLACIAGAATMMLGACLIAFMIYSGNIDEEKLQIACKPMLFLTAFTAAIICIVKEKDNYILPLTASSLIVYMFLIGMNIFLFEGKFPGIGSSSIAYILGVFMAACMKIVRWNPGSKGRRKYRFR